jgi:hypothetical protein
VLRDVLEKEMAVAQEAGLDALVAISPENFAYLTGFVVPSQPILRWRHAATVVTAEGATGVLSVDMEATTVRNHLPGVDVRVWEEFEGNAIAVLADLLRDLGLKARRIGVETDYLPARDMEQLRSRLPEVRWEAAEGLFDRMRMVKSPREVDLLRHLSRITDGAIGSALRAVRAGDTELDLAAAVTGSLYAGGAEHHKLLIVASGERSRFPNVGPTDRVLNPGDLIRLEIFGMIGGYHAGGVQDCGGGLSPPRRPTGSTPRWWTAAAQSSRCFGQAPPRGTCTPVIWRSSGPSGTTRFRSSATGSGSTFTKPLTSGMARTLGWNRGWPSAWSPSCTVLSSGYRSRTWWL